MAHGAAETAARRPRAIISGQRDDRFGQADAGQRGRAGVTQVDVVIVVGGDMAINGWTAGRSPMRPSARRQRNVGGGRVAKQRRRSKRATRTADVADQLRCLRANPDHRPSGGQRAARSARCPCVRAGRCPTARGSAPAGDASVVSMPTSHSPHCDRRARTAPSCECACRRDAAGRRDPRRSAP